MKMKEARKTLKVEITKKKNNNQHIIVYFQSTSKNAHRCHVSFNFLTNMRIHFVM